MSLQPHRQHDPVHRQITDLARPPSRPPSSPSSSPPVRTVTQAQIDKAMMPMVYSGGVVMLGVLLLLWANVIAFIVIAAGAFAFHHYSKERDALVRAQRSTPTRQPDMRVPHDLASLYAPPYASLQRQSDPQVEAIKAITSLEMAKLNHAHDSQMRDKDHGHDETIVRLNNKNQIDLTRLSTDAQVLV